MSYAMKATYHRKSGPTLLSVARMKSWCLCVI
uniref:Uncharacterized protein n=1 Tax=Myoviridae sp. ctshb19 TaxID=2825194 RepID=A0A8S5UGF6_9CAUD|nr:MAG TPA: hypothetical protein [Myoviridae sp. ctshb19]